jgi:hypothetical protein
VRELEDGIEQISHSFLAFSSLLLETDVPKRDSRVTLSLRETAQQCLALAKTGCDELEERDHLKAAAFTVNNVERSSIQRDSHLDAPGSSGNTSRRYQSPMEQSKRPLPNAQGLSPPVQTAFSFGTAMAPSTCHSSTALSYLPYPVPSPLLTSTRNEECKGLSQFLIKVCCQNGYQLLVNSPNDMKVKEIFGTFLSPTERNTFISYFCEGLQDHSGDLVDQMATVFAPIQPKRSNYTSEQLSTFYTASNSATTTQLDDLMDASDVQDMLLDRGVCIEEMMPPSSSSSLNSTFNVATFAECELLVTQKPWKLTNIKIINQVLAVRCICFGYGPVFRRQNVETSLCLTMSDNLVVSNPLLPGLESN